MNKVQLVMLQQNCMKNGGTTIFHTFSFLYMNEAVFSRFFLKSIFTEIIKLLRLLCENTAFKSKMQN